MEEGPTNTEGQTEEEVYHQVERLILEESDCSPHSAYLLTSEDKEDQRDLTSFQTPWRNELAFWEAINDLYDPDEYQKCPALSTFIVDENTETTTKDSDSTLLEYYYTADASKLIWRVSEDDEPNLDEVQDDEQVKVQVRPDGTTQISIEKNKQSLTPVEIK